MKKTPTLLLLCVLIFSVISSGCIGEKAQVNKSTKEFEGQTVVVCSGAGLMKPMNELIGMFENETGAKVEVHYGGSSEIFGILQTTCGCDVFIPGAWYYTKVGMDKGYVLNDTVKNVTLHIPVIAVPKGNPKNIHSLEDLAKPGVRVVLGDPKACAIGKVAKKMLEKNGLWENVSKNVVTFTPTVNQLLIYITTGQADAAIIWEDMTTWAQAKGKIEVIQIPPEQNIIKTIPTAVTVCAEKDGHLEVAKAFNEFIANHTEIWEKWGFRPWKG
ncbi:molybdate ABC transporter substrate-binding protein [Thermococcus sp. M39]|uniref:molybdate ABC transporter substrate-binding protein n=1 Tax=unclassified Thermococcus TaxID=2627626 RepID=UPI00143BDAC0|nr:MULTISPECIES: molybdate ABC transporter substrate-binding protein [unclassified Thermococcus]NJE07078.1 molybdate ABC transporter substrate-binding protein [Thermococcus sp. M39]NJE13616.1 molybdate ABC transporter substrate-binding protein [Thermococcus sp. LS2]